MTTTMPDNIPDLMLGYVNEINRELAGKDYANQYIQIDCKIIAWECLKRTYKPIPARRTSLISALGGVDPEIRLGFLEDRLQLIQSTGPSHDYVRFTLDPLAEYLAALHLITLCEKTDGWLNTLQHLASKQVESDEIHGFLVALRDCCQVRSLEGEIPDFVLPQLASMTNLRSSEDQEVA